MDEKLALNIRLRMEALITEREMMIWENQQRVHRGESMAYDAPAFSPLTNRFTKLWEELMHNG